MLTHGQYRSFGGIEMTVRELIATATAKPLFVQGQGKNISAEGSWDCVHGLSVVGTARRGHRTHWDVYRTPIAPLRSLGRLYGHDDVVPEEWLLPSTP